MLENWVYVWCMKSHGRIFLYLVDFWMRRARYSPGITKLRTAMVTATIEIYQTVQQELLPTPEKSHYTYNLRDLGKVNIYK